MNMLAPPPRLVPVDELPDIAGFIRSMGFMTMEEGQQLDAIALASWVLVRIDGESERWRCGKRDPITGKWANGCGGKHEFFTLGCIPRPFRGLQHGLMAYWQNVGAADAGDLSPAQRERLNSLNPIFGVPSLAASHPETAKKLATPETDVVLGAWVLGTIEPISAVKASVFAERINYRARRTVIRV